MAKKVNLETLVEVAKELNNVIACNPPICVVAEEENRKSIEAAIIECSDLITPDDEIAPKSKRVISFLLENREPAPVEEAKKKSAPKKEQVKVQPKTTKAQQGLRFSKVAALKMALESGDLTKEELLHKTIEIYEETTGKEAGMVTLSTLDVTLPVLIQFGAVEISNGKYVYKLGGK